METFPDQWLSAGTDILIRGVAKSEWARSKWSQMEPPKSKVTSRIPTAAKFVDDEHLQHFPWLLQKAQTFTYSLSVFHRTQKGQLWEREYKTQSRLMTSQNVLHNWLLAAVALSLKIYKEFFLEFVFINRYLNIFLLFSFHQSHSIEVLGQMSVYINN